MNKDFIENCKLLKSHFTKLTKAQTNTSQSQSKFDYETTSAAASINRAEQLLFLDRIDLLDKIDIEDIKQHALLKYNNYQQGGKNNRLCERNNQFKWNDDIYCTSSIPYNKEKIIIFNDSTDEYVTKKEELIEQYEKLEETSKTVAKIDGTEMTVKNINQKQKKPEKIVVEAPKIVTPEKLEVQGPEMTVINISPENIPPDESPKKSEKSAKVPELIIIPQQQKSIQSILEVKKIIPDESDVSDVGVNTDVTDVGVNTECLNEAKKIKRESHSSSKINNFIENVEKFRKFKTEKSKSFVSVAESTKAATPKPKPLISIHDKLTSYMHRFKAQKDIIEMQKEKLIEQNKIIAELKLNKIHIEAQESLDQAQKELKKISPVQKHKAKILDEFKPDKNHEINATLKLSKAPKMLQHMAERAREREERRILINERKRILDEEKQRIIERAMQKKLEDEQFEKQKRLAKLKEQREQLRQAEIMKQEMKHRYIENNEIAYLHYKKKLKKSAMESFKMVIYRIRIKTEISIRFYDNNIVIKFFKTWKENVDKLMKYKTFVSSRFYKKLCLKRCMRVWRKTHMEIIQRNQVAIDRFEMSLQCNIFMTWLHYTRKCLIDYDINAKKADLHYNRVVLYQCIHSWGSLPAILAIERVQYERKRKWRLRVAQILTDYDPLKTED